jgi:hypothetical protein
MKKYIRHPILCAALVAAGQFSGLCADEHPSAPPARMEAEMTTVTASVEAINYADREVTLKGPMGNKVTFTVDKRVKRLDEIKVGDLVEANYFVSVAAELRKPTAEEQKHPLMVLEGKGKAAPDAAPAAGAVRRFKVVTTVEGLDRPAKTITVKGPRGNLLTARVADPARLTQVHIGDTIVVTYTEAMAVSLEKSKKTASE